MTEYKLIDVNLLDSSPYQVREKEDKEDQEKFSEFKQSIINDPLGIRNSILVRPKEKRFQMAAGHRRVKVAKLSGILQVWCRIEDLTDEQMMKEVIVENYHRKALAPTETFVALEQYRKSLGLKEDAYKELHETLGISESWISKIYDGVDMAKYLKNGLSDGTDEGDEKPHTTVNKISETKPLEKTERILLIDKTTENDDWSRQNIHEVVVSLKKLDVERQRVLINASLNAEDTNILAKKYATEFPKTDPKNNVLFVEDKLIDKVADKTFTSANVVEIIDAIKPLPDKIKETLINSNLTSKDTVKIAEAIENLSEKSMEKIIGTTVSPLVKIELAKLKEPEVIEATIDRIKLYDYGEKGAIELINKVILGTQPRETTILDDREVILKDFASVLVKMNAWGYHQYQTLGKDQWEIARNTIITGIVERGQWLKRDGFLDNIKKNMKDDKDGV